MLMSMSEYTSERISFSCLSNDLCLSTGRVHSACPIWTAFLLQGVKGCIALSKKAYCKFPPRRRRKSSPVEISACGRFFEASVPSLALLGLRVLLFNGLGY